MDSNLLKIILHSCKDAVKEIEDTKEYQELDSTEIFVPSSERMFNALSMSLTNLLSHKVSKEAHQRYSVRLNVIDVLRNWCGIPEQLNSLHTLRTSENMLTFVKNIMKNCLTDAVLSNCTDSDKLVPLTRALLCLLPNNPEFIDDINRLVKRIAQVEQTEESEQLLCYIASKRNDISLSPSASELIYSTYFRKLIEEPLLNNFSQTLNPAEENMGTDCNITDITELCTEFPSVFLLTCSLLNELFMKLNYARSASNYIKTILNEIEKACERQGKNIIDLYPRNLQSCLILMRIEPYYHSAHSRDYTVHALRDISAGNVDDALILLSHFPAWLKEYASYVNSIPDNV